MLISNMTSVLIIYRFVYCYSAVVISAGGKPVYGPL